MSRLEELEKQLKTIQDEIDNIKSIGDVNAGDVLEIISQEGQSFYLIVIKTTSDNFNAISLNDGIVQWYTWKDSATGVVGSLHSEGWVFKKMTLQEYALQVVNGEVAYE